MPGENFMHEKRLIIANVLITIGQFSSLILFIVGGYFLWTEKIELVLFVSLYSKYTIIYFSSTFILLLFLLNVRNEDENYTREKESTINCFWSVAGNISSTVLFIGCGYYWWIGKIGLCFSIFLLVMSCSFMSFALGIGLLMGSYFYNGPLLPYILYIILSILSQNGLVATKKMVYFNQ